MTHTTQNEEICRMPDCQLKEIVHKHTHNNCTYKNQQNNEEWEMEFDKLGQIHNSTCVLFKSKYDFGVCDCNAKENIKEFIKQQRKEAYELGWNFSEAHNKSHEEMIKEQAVKEFAEQLEKEMKPAIDDFEDTGKKMIESAVFTGTGSEMLQNVGYIKGLFHKALEVYEGK